MYKYMYRHTSGIYSVYVLVCTCTFSCLLQCFAVGISNVGSATEEHSGGTDTM